MEGLIGWGDGNVGSIRSGAMWQKGQLARVITEWSLRDPPATLSL